MKADFHMDASEVIQEPVLYGDFVHQTGDKSYQELDDPTLVRLDVDARWVRIHRL